MSARVGPLWCAVTLHCLFGPHAGTAASIDQDSITAAVRWTAYWDGADSLGSKYRPGKQVEARLLRSQAATYIFLAEINLELDLSVGHPDQVESVRVKSLAEGTNSEVVASFLRTRQTAPDCRGEIKPAPSPGAQAQQIGRTLPVARPCSSSEKIITDETTTFVLPELTPPEAIRNKTVPADSGKLVATIGRELESRSRRCGAMIASIPYYSDTDPRVYVLVRATTDCPDGVATFSRQRNGEWQFGKFFVDAPREQISDIIARIKTNVAFELNR